MTDTIQPGPAEPIIARGGKYYRNTRYLMSLLLIGMGIWFGFDGYVNWPKSNDVHDNLERQRVAAQDRHDEASAEQLLEQENQHKHHSPTDIWFQKVLCFTMPPLGILLLIWARYNSRGEYRMEGNILHVPGHPPVELSQITEIDRRLWDRKGIAFIQYNVGNGGQRKLRLDDFVYDRPPTDEIFKRIEAFVTPAATPPVES
jgi:hypothetical protein